MIDFVGYSKIPRLMREMIVTEKIDGTNAQVWISDDLNHVVAGSRHRWLLPGQPDNHGFGAWVQKNREELLKLGPGHHFGEWWGQGIGRNYGLAEKRFSLFNTYRWGEDRPECCHVVPVLHQGVFNVWDVDLCLETLKVEGSRAAPGFMKPEGVVIFHVAGNLLFKRTIEEDEEGKGTTLNQQIT